MSPHDLYTCEEAFRRLDDYLDRELPPEEMEGVRAHLETCRVCADEFEFEATVLREVRGKLGRIRAPAALLGRIFTRIRAERV